MKLDLLLLSVERLRTDVRAVRMSGAPVARAMYERMVEEYNALLTSLKQGDVIELLPIVRTEADYSFTGRSAKPEALSALLAAVEAMHAAVDDAAREAREPNDGFFCFKTDASCPKKIQPHRFKFFIATSFSPEYRAITDRFMEKAQAELGVAPEKIFRADVFLSTRDIMCKICQGMQESDCVIANITGLNSNVMVELGMAIGMNKKIVLLKDRRSDDREITDIKCLEYTEYADDDEWFRHMTCILRGKRLI